LDDKNYRKVRSKHKCEDGSEYMKGAYMAKKAKKKKAKKKKRR
jgi:hypothetical protein